MKHVAHVVRPTQKSLLNYTSEQMQLTLKRVEKATQKYDLQSCFMRKTPILNKNQEALM